jgi:membrane protein
LSIHRRQKHKASLATPTREGRPGSAGVAVHGILRRQMRVRRRDLVQKFFNDRGPHLAAMIAYFALLSFVPLTFLSLALLGLTGRADESSFLVREIKKTLPGTPIDQIIGLVHTVQDNAAALGIVGGLALLWTSLSLFSVLESALNIVYGRPNRSFLHGKGLAFLLMVGSLVTLFVALLVGSLGVSALQEYAPGFVSNRSTAYVLSIGVSLLGVFLFLVSCYFALTNEDELTVGEVLPGAIFAAILLEGTFQVLPLYQRYADLNPALRAFGAPAILLVWLYVMANVIVFGAELNWWLARRTQQRQEDELAGLA